MPLHQEGEEALWSRVRWLQGSDTQLKARFTQSQVPVLEFLNTGYNVLAMPAASGCPQASYKDQLSPMALSVEDRQQVIKQGNHRVSKGKPLPRYTLGMQLWSCCTLSFMCCSNWLVTFPFLLEAVGHKLCVKWPHDHGSKWHQVEIFIQSTSEKVSFCTQRHQLKLFRKANTLFSLPTVFPREVKKNSQE